MLKSRKIGMVLSGAAVVTMALAGCGTANNTSNNAAGSGASNATGNTNTNTATNNASTGNQTSTASDTNKNIKIGYVNWSEDVATSYLWKNLLSQKGYNVTLTSMSDAGPLFAGLSKGGLDVFFDTWLPVTHKQYMQKFGSSLVNLGKWYQGKTQEGFVVPTYVKDVNSISDLKAHASEFNGQIIGIDPGAGEMGLAKKAVTQYGLSGNMKLVASSSTAMLSQLTKAEAQKKPVVVTLWSPHWAFAKYKLKYLKDPKGVFGKAGWIQTEANKTWSSNHPTLTGYLKNFQLTPTQLGTLEEDINNASSKDAGVKKWISDNQSVVNGWFNTNS